MVAEQWLLTIAKHCGVYTALTSTLVLFLALTCVCYVVQYVCNCGGRW